MESNGHVDSTHKTKVEQGRVQSFLDSAYVGKVSNLAYISGGEGSQAFSFEVNGEKLIIRLNRHDDSGFKKDQYAFMNFASPKVPIPEILQIGTTGDGNYFAISKKVEGELLSTLASEGFSEILPNLFETLETIHRVPISDTEGYGKWNDHGIGEKNSWKDMLLDVDQYAKNMFEHTFLEKDVWDKIYARFIELLPFCPEDKYLLHGDYSIDNVLVKDGKVAGVIDWGGSKYGDYLYDVAWQSFWSKGFDYEKAYLEFSQAIEKKIENFEERLLCYKLYIGLGSLSFYVYSNQKDKYERTKEKLLELVS